MEGMVTYTQAAVERAMKVQEVILRAMAKKITWWQAAEIIGISDRQMRRWHERLIAHHGHRLLLLPLMTRLESKGLLSFPLRGLHSIPQVSSLKIEDCHGPGPDSHERGSENRGRFLGSCPALWHTV
jgi:hypothetical protein